MCNIKCSYIEQLTTHSSVLRPSLVTLRNISVLPLFISQLWSIRFHFSYFPLWRHLSQFTCVLLQEQQRIQWLWVCISDCYINPMENANFTPPLSQAMCCYKYYLCQHHYCVMSRRNPRNPVGLLYEESLVLKQKILSPFSMSPRSSLTAVDTPYCRLPHRKLPTPRTSAIINYGAN